MSEDIRILNNIGMFISGVTVQGKDAPAVVEAMEFIKQEIANRQRVAKEQEIEIAVKAAFEDYWKKEDDDAVDD